MPGGTIPDGDQPGGSLVGGWPAGRGRLGLFAGPPGIPALGGVLFGGICGGSEGKAGGDGLSAPGAGFCGLGLEGVAFLDFVGGTTPGSVLPADEVTGGSAKAIEETTTRSMFEKAKVHQSGRCTANLLLKTTEFKSHQNRIVLFQGLQV